MTGSWFFWLHAHGAWACVGYVHAPRAAALAIAHSEAARFGRHAVLAVEHFGYGSAICERGTS